MSDVAIRAAATAGVPRDYKIPGAQEILPKSVSATMDGTSAASAWFPCLQLLDPGGNVMFSAIAGLSIAAGASADVSWFPGLAGAATGSVQALLGASIEATSPQTIPDGVTTDLQYQSVLFDTGGMANLGSDNRKLTVQTPGLYIVLLEVGWPYSSPSAGRRLAGITMNGFSASPQIGGDSRMPIWAPVGGSGGGAPHTTNSVTVLAAGNAGDFFASNVQQASGASQTVSDSSNTTMSAILVGRL